MSLFEWSTPERRKADSDQILPIIPNEIYICIFEFTVPTRWTFFANFCLPRIFESVEFSGRNFRHHTKLRNAAVYKTSREAALCTQIAAKQPLALSLAQRVRSCHFLDWGTVDERTLVTRSLTERYLAGMLHMKNIREVRFSDFVVEEHWRAIATLGSLEKLHFDSCRFRQGQLDVLPGQKVNVKVSHLRVHHCTGHREILSAIDPQYLRTLDIDPLFLDHVDWLPQSSLIDLRLCFLWPDHMTPYAQHNYLKDVHTLLTQPPQSLETLWLSADLGTAVARDNVRSMFADPAWKNLSFLRSLTLEVHLDSEDPNKHADMLSFILDRISPLTDLQSLTLKAFSLKMSPTVVRRTLHDTLGPSSSLTYAGIFDKVFRLVDGEWSDASPTPKGFIRNKCT